MIFTYLKTALRNFRKQLIYFGISTIGLTFGFLCVIIIALWINETINYNRSYSNSDRIYKVFIEEKRNNSVHKHDWTSFPIADELAATIPEIENATRCTDGNITVKFNSNIYNEGRVCFTDESFFKIFDFSFISGDKEKALSEINSIIISEKAAKKYFGDNDAIGENLLINNKYSFTVSGVINDIPVNTDFQFDFFLRAKEFAPSLASSSTSWEALNFQTYLLSTRNSDAGIIKEKMKDVMVQHIQGSQQFLNIQPLEIAHLYNVSGEPTNIKSIYTFGIIAILTLLIAYINYINLSGVSYQKRIYEFNVKRIIGSGTKHLFMQTFIDSLLLVFISAIFALLLSSLLMPLLNRFTGKEMNQIFFTRRILLLFIAIVFGSLPLLSLPSVMILSLKSIQGSFKNKIKLNPNLSYRNLLIMAQFVIAIVLIVSTIISTRQMNFILKKDTGLDLDNIVYVRMNGDSRNHYKTLKNELLNIPDVTNVTYAYNLPTTINTSCNIDDWARKQEQNKLDVAYTVGDFDYIKTMGLEIVDGRDFSKSRANDYDNYVLNETAIKALGIESPIGSIINFSCWKQGEIIGVVKDFNYNSLHSKIRPLVIASPSWGYHYLIVKTASSDIASVVDEIKENWLRINPDCPFEYNYLKDTIALKYSVEKHQKDLIMSFTLMAIILSLMGLFGLVGLTVQNRIKEIGIRKVSGATVFEILAMLNKNFVKWVAIAFIIATPIAYYAMNKWLENFAYKTTLSWWIFALTGLLALGIALLTVSWQSWRAATRNPVEALRYE